MPWEGNRAVTPKYWRIALYPPQSDLEEAVTWLYGLGATGLEWEDGRIANPPFTDIPLEPQTPFVAVYVPEADYPSWEQAVSQMAERRDWTWEAREVVPEDWETSWKAYYQPVALANGYSIVPAWQETPAGDAERVIRLDPGMAFGTGTHATTRMCLNALVFADLADRRVLDLGAGSGILGILALKRGAREAVLVEPDAVALKALRHNIALNQVGDRARVIAGTLKDVPPAPFDVLLVNIIWEIIAHEWSRLQAYLAPRAVIYVSGLLEERMNDMMQLVRSTGQRIEQVEREDGWLMLVVAHDSVEHS
ncbi:MAG: 50S ribosomal protein L11 methyltransferase [Sulfobacillus sp.]|nr:50S ribosomal protein L11 methyltransferase [Sulfobacillus sp.]